MDPQLTREMYREHILELYKNPENFGELQNPTYEKEDSNPLCGDEIKMQIIMKDDKVADVKFTGKGCAISIASASLLTEYIKGKSIEELKNITKEDLLELLEIPVGPVRLKCALLSLQTLHKAIGL